MHTARNPACQRIPFSVSASQAFCVWCSSILRYLPSFSLMKKHRSRSTVLDRSCQVFCHRYVISSLSSHISPAHRMFFSLWGVETSKISAPPGTIDRFAALKKLSRSSSVSR